MADSASDELRKLYEADQLDRREGRLEGIPERDQSRWNRVDRLVSEGRLKTGDDYFHAAMVFQHGRTPDSFLRAHHLAKTAVELGCDKGRWLAAAAYDRWLVHQGRPQKYGTQFRAEDGRWVLCDVDPATTDAERATWNVPSLQEAQERAEKRTRHSPPSSWRST